jgi:hypothetical protein
MYNAVPLTYRKQMSIHIFTDATHVQRQEKLGAEFKAAIFNDLENLYED